MRERGFYWRGNRRLAESCNSKDLFHDSFPPREEGEGRQTEERDVSTIDGWTGIYNFPPTRGNLIILLKRGDCCLESTMRLDSFFHICLLGGTERWSTNDGIC